MHLIAFEIIRSFQEKYFPNKTHFDCVFISYFSLSIGSNSKWIQEEKIFHSNPFIVRKEILVSHWTFQMALQTSTFLPVQQGFVQRQKLANQILSMLKLLLKFIHVWAAQLLHCKRTDEDWFKWNKSRIEGNKRR